MNYELAQKLYKAGFPGIACSEESPVPGYSYPNLSELIDFVDGSDKLKDAENDYIQKALFKLQGRKNE